MTRFALWPRWSARLLLGVLVALLVTAAVQSPAPSTGPQTPPYSDIRLYRAVVARVSRGEDYYRAAATEHRAHNYPTTPAQVFRQPTEALLLVALRTDLIRTATLFALAMGTTFALWRALGVIDISPRLRLWGSILMVTGIANAITPSGAYMHEIWASLLIALSLALRRPDRWVLSVCVGLIACLFRELALPYLLVMATLAFVDRRPREGFAWAAAIVLFCGVFAAHMSLASALHRNGDVSSPGWLSLGGWPFILATARWNALLVGAPAWIIAAVVCLSALGLSGNRHPWVSRAALTVVGYLTAFAVVGRPNNDYWGILYAPLLPLGLVFAPAALRDLASRAAWGDFARRRVAPVGRIDAENQV